MNKIKIALQKSGRLHVESLKLMNDCGININVCYKDKLRVLTNNYPVEIFFLRDDDIPAYIQDEIADIGIVGKNVVCEQQKQFLIKEKLGFGACRLSLAIPKYTIYKEIKDLYGKRIATTYPNILKDYLENKNIYSDIVNISGSVEMAPDLMVADAICDIVSSGETLFKHNLKEIDQVFISEAVLLCCTKNENKMLIKKLLSRIRAVKNAKVNRYISFYVPTNKLDEIYLILLKAKSIKNKLPPMSYPIDNTKYSYVQYIIEESAVFQTLYSLEMNGAENIIIFPVQALAMSNA